MAGARRSIDDGSPDHGRDDERVADIDGHPASACSPYLFVRAVGAEEYRTFFKTPLGRGWVIFEIAYALFVILILAVFGAAAGEIGQATFGLPNVAGMLALMAGIAGVAALGNRSVERLFAWVSVLLYGVYALFLLLALGALKGRLTHW